LAGRDGGPLTLGHGVEVPIDGSTWHPEEVCDLLNGFLAGVVELLGEGDLFGVEFRAPASVAAASACGGESVAGVGDDELALELAQQIFMRFLPGWLDPTRRWNVITLDIEHR
jgi:hypothetical protein